MIGITFELQINNMDETLIKSLLRSMAHGCKEARQYFPRLLQIKRLANDHTKKLFNDEVIAFLDLLALWPCPKQFLMPGNCI